MNNIVFDVDGIILDYNNSFNDYVKKRFNKCIHFNIYDFRKQLLEQGCELDANDLYQIYREFENTNPVIPLLDKNIPEIMNKIMEHNNIIIISKYSNLQNRIENLKEMKIPYNELICPCDNKIDYIKIYKPTFIIEDSPEMLELLIDNNYNVIIPKKWNYSLDVFNKHKDKTNVYGYDKFEEILERIIIS